MVQKLVCYKWCASTEKRWLMVQVACSYPADIDKSLLQKFCKTVPMMMAQKDTRSSGTVLLLENKPKKILSLRKGRVKRKATLG